MRIGTILRWHALKNILKSEIEDYSTIIDIGSYDGVIADKIKELLPNIEITVIDVDISGLISAKKRGLNTLNASALSLPIKDNQADVVFCLDLIEHVEDDNKVVQEISRVLKKEGILILTTPMQDGISFPIMNKQKIKEINKEWGHVRSGYSLNEIRQLFNKNNISIKRKDTYFNFVSRWVYRILIFSNFPFIGKSLIYRAPIMLEPYLKKGAQEYIIIGKKNVSA